MCVLSLCIACLQARNIAVCVEFRDSDEEDALPLKARCSLRNYIIPGPLNLYIKPV